jgi:hypothetical protein
VRNIGVEEFIGQVVWMRDEHLAPELAVSLARGSPEHEPPDRLSDYRGAENTQRQWHIARDAGRMAGDDEPMYTRWLLEREHRRPPATNRVRDERRRLELEPVKDVSEERARVSREIDAVVVERIGETVARTVDREHAMASSE